MGEQQKKRSTIEIWTGVESRSVAASIHSSTALSISLRFAESAETAFRADGIDPINQSSTPVDQALLSVMNLNQNTNDWRCPFP